jgi:putative oxygen-independent coproporphyrinogen III oxidase
MSLTWASPEPRLARAPIGGYQPSVTRRKAPSPQKDAPGIGVYVHFPWCLQKCPYCDFLSFATDRGSIPHAAYADAVIEELRRRKRDLGPRQLKSIFFGGGTPSLWASAELGRVVAAIREAFELESESLECTAECNPSSFDQKKAEELMAAGINRVSIGVQSLNRQRLEFLGRLHDGPGALTALSAAIEAGVPRVNADLIFGVSGQSVNDAIAEARAVGEMGVTHVSAYSLTIEPGTQFGADAAKGRLPLLPDETIAESFLGVSETLRDAGFDHYEISNFARDNHRARHNLGYWCGDDYLGLGCGAWGTVTTERLGTQTETQTQTQTETQTQDRVRYRNTPSPERYLAGAADWAHADLSVGGLGPKALQRDVEPIDGATALRERLMLGLRLAEGVDVERAARALGVDPWPEERRRAVARLVERGRLERDGPDRNRLRVPRDQWLFADGTIAEVL